MPGSEQEQSIGEEFVKRHLDRLAKPAYNVGDVVKFQFGERTMTGDIRSITASHKEDGTNLFGNHYTIYANAHGRWVDEKHILGGA